MNRDLAKYIVGLKDEVSLRLWLSAIAKSARNGTANLMIKDLMLENRLTRAQLDKYFKPQEAEKLELIKILVQSDTFISINFKKGTKQQASNHQKKLAEKGQIPLLGPMPEKTKTVIIATPETTTTAVIKGFLTEIPKVYNPSSDLIKACIGNYITFFKQLQIDKASLVGITLSLESAAAPKIEGEDVKHIKELSKHFAKLQNIINEEQIMRCFIRIYENWWSLSEFINSKPELRYIRYNINRIILEIQNLNNTNGKGTDKKQNELNSKIKRTGSKDYSHLANSRKKDD